MHLSARGDECFSSIVFLCKHMICSTRRSHPEQGRHNNVAAGMFLDFVFRIDHRNCGCLQLCGQSISAATLHGGRDS